MKTLILALALTLAFQSTPNAQTTATLAWDTTAPLAEVQGYSKTVRIDGTALTATIACTAKSATETTCSVPAPTLATGSHTIEISHTSGGYTTVYSFTGVDPSKGPKDVNGFVSITTRKVIPIP